MNSYKIIFESGVTETIEVGSMEYNEHIGQIEIKNEDGKELDQYYLDFDHIAAIIPQ